MKKTLLEVAKSVPMLRRKDWLVDNEEIDVAIAWLKGEIMLKQVAVAYGELRGTKWTGNSLYRIAVVIREGVARGRITIAPKT